MKVALLSYGAEGLGLQYLSRFLKKGGHDVRLFYDPCLFDDKLLLHYPVLNKFFSFKKWILREMVDYKPDIVGISVLTDTFPWAISYAREIKKIIPGAKIVAGGTHVTILPEKVAKEPYFDYLIRGEGEAPFLELANSLQKQDDRTDIPGVWIRTPTGFTQNEIAPLLQDLTFFGEPDRTIYEPFVNTKSTHLAISSRGCLYVCSYCHHNAVSKLYIGKGRYLRRLSPEQFINYLKESHNKYRYKSLQIYDEIFTYDEEWLEEFSSQYRKELNIPYICLGHPHFMSEKVIRFLNDSNCFGIQIGIQSLNQSVRSKFLRRHESNIDINEMVAILEKYKLPYQFDMIFGLPGDTQEDYIKAIKFFTNCKSASKINTLFLSLQPKTEMVEEAIESGIISEDDKESIDAGMEGCRVGEPGSIRDKNKYKAMLSYMLMYKIAVKFPAYMTNVLLSTGLYRYLGFFEPFLGHFIRLLGVDKRDRTYVRHYMRYFSEFFFRKLTGRKMFNGLSGCKNV